MDSINRAKLKASVASSVGNGQSTGGNDFNNRKSPSDGQAQVDPNEFSGILSSPGLCGNNSYLERQDDIMNNFLKNLKGGKPKSDPENDETLLNSNQFSKMTKDKNGQT